MPGAASVEGVLGEPCEVHLGACRYRSQHDVYAHKFGKKGRQKGQEQGHGKQALEVHDKERGEAENTDPDQRRVPRKSVLNDAAFVGLADRTDDPHGRGPKDGVHAFDVFELEVAVINLPRPGIKFERLAQCTADLIGGLA